MGEKHNPAPKIKVVYLPEFFTNNWKNGLDRLYKEI